MITDITIPSVLYAGNNSTWSVALPAYPASSYDLDCILKFNLDDPITISGVADGDDYLFTQSVKINQSGDYKAQYVVKDQSTGEILETSEFLTVPVKQLLLNETDSRSHNEIILDALKAQMENRATQVQKSLELPNGTKIGYIDHSELMKMVNAYQTAVNKEKRIAAGYSPKKNMLPRINKTT